MSDLAVPEPLTAEVIAWKTAQRVCQTEFVPQAYRGRPDAVFAAILYGRELGMGPMSSMQQINMIKGKPSLSPEAMRARVFADGHRIETAEYGDDRVVLVGTRTNGATATVTWTLDDARRAGLGQGDNWKKYPRAMLLARATSELCRLLFPDVISGASYTPEELHAVDQDLPADLPERHVDVDTGEIIDDAELVADDDPEPEAPTRPVPAKRKARQSTPAGTPIDTNTDLEAPF
jgi:hypothetical protein